jgi:hypothetical protein
MHKNAIQALFKIGFRTLDLQFFRVYSFVEKTGKLVFNDHYWDSQLEAVVDRWSLFKGFIL